MHQMLSIQDSRVWLLDGKWLAKCVCGKTSGFSAKSSALRMLQRDSCRHCKRDYRSVVDVEGVYKNNNGKWCSTCSGCGVEQAYTRLDHAKQSEVGDWQCKKCVAKLKGFDSNALVGDERRLYNKFRKSANVRGIPWRLKFHDFIGCYKSKCALTGWELSMKYIHCTASFDRIDSSMPYQIGNVQWVHTMVNMCKNKYAQDDFIKMCKAIANRVD